MENDSSIRPNNNRKRGPVPGSLPATSSSSMASSTSVERQDAIVEMPTTPEQLESMVSIRVTAALASKDIMNNSSVPTPLALNATFGSTILTDSTVTSPTPPIHRPKRFTYSKPFLVDVWTITSNCYTDSLLFLIYDYIYGYMYLNHNIIPMICLSKYFLVLIFFSFSFIVLNMLPLIRIKYSNKDKSRANESISLSIN